MKREFIIIAKFGLKLPRIALVNCKVDQKVSMFFFFLMLSSAFCLSFIMGVHYLQTTAVS